MNVIQIKITKRKMLIFFHEAPFRFDILCPGDRLTRFWIRIKGGAATATPPFTFISLSGGTHLGNIPKTMGN